MDKEHFESLSINEQIEFINSELTNKDISFSKYMEESKGLLGIGRKGLSERFKKEGYKLINNQYVKLQEEEFEQLSRNTKKSIGVQKEEEPSKLLIQPTQVIFTEEEIKILKDLISERIITKSMQEAIAVQSGEYTKTSIRVDKEVWQQFLVLSKGQSLKQQELITVALKEFIEKYKKE